MLSRRLLLQSPQSRSSFICFACAQRPLWQLPRRSFTSSRALLVKIKGNKKKSTVLKSVSKKKERKKAEKAVEDGAKEAGTKVIADALKDALNIGSRKKGGKEVSKTAKDGARDGEQEDTEDAPKRARKKRATEASKPAKPSKTDKDGPRIKRHLSGKELITKISSGKELITKILSKERELPNDHHDGRKPSFKPISLKEALLADKEQEPLQIEILEPADLEFKAVDVEIPPVPMLSYGLDRVLFNPGVYRLQDPSSRVYNFDPYLEKIMPVQDFDFDALSEYKTSSRDEELLAMQNRLGTTFTGSTSSMSGVLQHFHFLLSGTRPLNHGMLSKGFPSPSQKFSKVTLGPAAIFLRHKEGRYAIDADKSYDDPNIMSWLGHSLEKLLTTDRDDFERYRRSSPDETPKDDNSSRCYHYSTQGNFLMRSQLDAVDPRLPGTGIFDLKTRAVVSIRMDHKEYETGSGYQIHHNRGEWESFEREFYDMTRATMLKYSLQVRMGRMNGIFVAYHNIERIFGFQFLAMSDMDEVLHGQTDPSLGDQEFKTSIRLLDELLQKATSQFPETTLRLHFHNRASGKTPFMYIFAEPVTEEQADEIQNRKQSVQKAFARDIVGINRDDPEIQKEWHDIQDRVDNEVGEDENRGQVEGAEEVDEVEEDDAELVESDDAREDTEAGLEETTEESEDRSTEEGTEESTAEEAEEGIEETENTEEDTEAVDEAGEEGVEQVRSKPAAGPLMGWTLAIRNRVNGVYVQRPENLTPEDVWTVEYHIKEIAPETTWGLYEKVKAERAKLIDMTEERNNSLENYRAVIRNFSNRGRKWREEQDKVDEQMEKQIFRPLGPGSETENKGDA